MKRMRFISGQGNGRVTIPSGQLLLVSMVPGAGGSYVQIANSDAIWVPGGTALGLEAEDLGACCGAEPCDQYPGDVQIEIIFGQLVQLPPSPEPHGDEPLAWLVIYNGC